MGAVQSLQCSSTSADYFICSSGATAVCNASRESMAYDIEELQIELNGRRFQMRSINQYDLSRLSIGILKRLVFLLFQKENSNTTTTEKISVYNFLYQPTHFLNKTHFDFIEIQIFCAYFTLDDGKYQRNEGNGRQSANEGSRQSHQGKRQETVDQNKGRIGEEGWQESEGLGEGIEGQVDSCRLRFLYTDNKWVEVEVVELSATAEHVDENETEVVESEYTFGLEMLQTADSGLDPNLHVIWLRDEETRLSTYLVSNQDALGPTSQSDSATTTSEYRKVSDVSEESIVYLILKKKSAIPADFRVSIEGNRKFQALDAQIYTVFLIVVRHGILEWTITRRFSAFYELNQKCQELFPSIKLPPFPSKSWWLNMNSDFIMERQIELEIYLRKIAAIPQIIECVDVLSFLGAVSTTMYEHENSTGCQREIVHLKGIYNHINTGDIIMFRSRDPASGLQRKVTRAEWDHVAMVVKKKNKLEFMLFEATGEGVTVFPLISRIRAYSSCFTKYIVLRKLRAPGYNAIELEKKLLDFVEQVEGKPYSLTLSKFLGYDEVLDEPLEDFFCSELIAAALKSIGLIDEGARSSSYWPGSFASGDRIDEELSKKGAFLDKEVVIDCRVLEVSRARRTSSPRKRIEQLDRRRILSGG